MHDIDIVSVMDQIESLKAENLKLAKRKALRERPKNVLKNFPQPDNRLFVTGKQVEELLVSEKVLVKSESNDVRSFFRFFGIGPVGQSKPVGDKGRGKQLFLRSEVIDAINHIKKFSSDS